MVKLNKELKDVNKVSPYIGEWIEIAVYGVGKRKYAVSPYIGEWIEIHFPSSPLSAAFCLTLHR